MPRVVLESSTSGPVQLSPWAPSSALGDGRGYSHHGVGVHGRPVQRALAQLILLSVGLARPKVMDAWRVCILQRFG